MDTQLGIFKHLKTEHDEVKKLLDQTESAQPRQRKDLLAEIKSKLVPHARAEEKTLYAALYEAEPSKDLSGLTKEGYAEHETADHLLGELEGMSVDDEMWKAKFSVFKENVEHHIKEEEAELFEKAKNFISEDASSELLQAFKLEKTRFESSLSSQHRIKPKTISSHLKEGMLVQQN